MAVILSRISSRTARVAAAWVHHQPALSLHHHPAITSTIQRHAITTCKDELTLERNTLTLPSHDKPIRSVMAPMVAASDYAFRCLVARHGVDLLYTQMLHARSLVEKDDFQENHLDFPFRTHSLLPSQLDCIQGMSQYDNDAFPHDPELHSSSPKHQPLIVQLAGHDAQLMQRAFDVLIQKECEFAGVDVNLGCPQGMFSLMHDCLCGLEFVALMH